MWKLTNDERIDFDEVGLGLSTSQDAFLDVLLVSNGLVDNRVPVDGSKLLMYVNADVSRLQLTPKSFRRCIVPRVPKLEVKEVRNLRKLRGQKVQSSRKRKDLKELVVNIPVAKQLRSARSSVRAGGASSSFVVVDFTED